MIFKGKNAFPIYVISVKPGKEMAKLGYTGSSGVAFDHIPTKEEVIESLKEQEELYWESVAKFDVKFPIDKKNKEAVKFQKLKKKNKPYKIKFKTECIKTVKMLGIPELPECALSASQYEDNAKNHKEARRIEISRRWVKTNKKTIVTLKPSNKPKNNANKT